MFVMELKTNPALPLSYAWLWMNGKIKVVGESTRRNHTNEVSPCIFIQLEHISRWSRRFEWSPSVIDPFKEKKTISQVQDSATATMIVNGLVMTFMKSESVDQLKKFIPAEDADLLMHQEEGLMHHVRAGIAEKMMRPQRSSFVKLIVPK